MGDAAVSIVHHPTVLQLGPLPLTGFGVAMLAAFVIGQAVAQSVLTQRGEDPNVMGDVLIAAVIGGLVGGKVYYSILTRDPAALVERAGFVFWGGLIGGIVASFLWIRFRKLSFARISDASAAGLAAAYAVGRTGCWAVGDDYGRAWASRFAVKFPEGAPPSTVQNLISQFGQADLAGRPPAEVVSVYPTQLFEVAMGLAMFAILWKFRNHRHAAGWLFGAYCLLAGVERIVIEVFRAKDDRFFGPFTVAQVIGALFVVAGAAWMAARRGAAGPAAGARATA